MADIDNIIVLLYFIAIVVVGIVSSKKIQSLHDYSVSNVKYGAFVLMATLSASFIGGGFSTGNASKVAIYGIGNIVALCGFSISICIIALFLVPRIKRFTNAISCGEIMNMAYGKGSQIFTGIFGMFVCAGILGAQVGAFGYIFNVFLGLPSHYGIIIGFGIVLIYSTLGGMKSVVTTDVIQFITLGVGMPLLLYFSVKETGGINYVIENTPKEYFNILNGYSPMAFISLFITLALGEALVPPYVQRLLMGRDLKVTAKGTLLSGIISVPFFIVTGLIGLVGFVYFMGTDINVNSIMQSIIKSTAPIGLRGIIIAGMFSIIMSSADSFLNSASVGIVNDVIIPLSNRNFGVKKSLTLARCANIIIGVLSVMLAMYIPNVLDILIFSYSFWSPVILIPLGAAMLGIKSSKQAFYSCMIAGIVTMCIWSYALKNPFDLDGTIVGVIFNLIVFSLVTHFYKPKKQVEIA